MRKIGIKYAVFIHVFLLSFSANSEISLGTYNIKYLTACIDDERREKIIRVINSSDADIFAIQEVKDRKALEYIFSPLEWNLIIDDDSRSNQDLAFAIRKGMEYRLSSNNVYNAGLDDYLFPDSEYFPGARDVLRVYVYFPEIKEEVLILNHHAKSRYEGRIETDDIRIEAALSISEYVKFQDYHVILLGDFNDTPSDSSLRVLESGVRYSSDGDPESGALFFNIFKAAAIDDHVTYGLNSRNVSDGTLDTRVFGSYADNIESFYSGGEVNKGLYDQILISRGLFDISTQIVPVFPSLGDAAAGNQYTRASDHIPVYTKIFNISQSDGGVQISSLLPNPVGTDRDNEKICISNNYEFYVSGRFSVLDRSEGAFELNLEISPESVSCVIVGGGLTLNNAGDEIRLYLDGELLDTVVYESSVEGQYVEYEGL